MVTFPKMKLGTDARGRAVKVELLSQDGKEWIDLSKFVTGVNVDYEASRVPEVTLSLYAEITIGPVPE